MILPKYPYQQVGTSFNRIYRENESQFRKDVESDIKEQKTRVDDLISGVEQPSEIVDSRGKFKILRDRFDNVDLQLTETDLKIGQIQSGVKGTYPTLADLQTALPTGDTGNYVVAFDGHIYNWNGTSWVDTGIQYQATGIAKRSVNRNSLSNDVTSFYGEKVKYYATSSFEEQLALQFTFDITDIDITNLPIDVSYDVFTNDPNVKSARIKIYPTDTPEYASTYGGRLSTETILNQNEITEIEYSWTPTADYNYLQVFVWVNAVDNANPGEYYYKDFQLTINGALRTSMNKQEFAGNAIFEGVTDVPISLVTKNYTDTIINDKLDEEKQSFDGYHANALQNLDSQTVDPRIQVAVTFDLVSVQGTLGTTEEFEFATIVESESGKLLKLYSEYYFNNNAIVGSISNSLQISRTGLVNVVDEKTDYIYKGSVSSHAYRYVHCFIDVYLSEILSVPIDVFLNKFSFKIKGSYMPRLDGAAFWKPNTADTIKFIKKKESQVAVFGDVQGTLKNKLFNIKWNVMGDSITYGAYTTKVYHQYVQEDYGINLVRNYGISGSTVANVGVDERNSMALRYDSMDNDADIITVFGGTNDYGASVPLGVMSDRTVNTFYGAYHVLLSGLIEKYPTKKIAVFTPIQRDRDGNVISDIGLIPYVDAVKEVAAFYSVPCLDLFNGGGLYAGSQTVLSLLMPDGTHPNAEGHKIIADKIGSFLSSV